MSEVRDINNYSKMQVSFYSHFNGGKKEAEIYWATFDYLASALKSLYIKNVYVYVSKISHNMDFCMNFGEKILLIVGMNAFERENDNITCAIYHEGELIDMDNTDLITFKEMVTIMQNELYG